MEKTEYINDLIDYDFTKKGSIVSILEKMIMDHIENNMSDKISTKSILPIFSDGHHHERKNLSEADISLLLAYMSKKGELIEKADTVLRVCPICKSNITILECQECGSHHIKEVEKIIHICGYLDEIKYFIYEEGLMCPQCGDPILVGNEVKKSEYRHCDTSYRCMDCGASVDKYNGLEKNIECNKCKNTYRNIKTDFITFYRIYPSVHV